jgi:uncharacterized protein (TIRG00374 family)
MEPAKKTTHLNFILILLIAGLIAFILYIYFFIDPQQIFDILSKTNPTVYASAFIAYLLYTFCSSLVWHRLLDSLTIKITKRKAFLFTWVGLFFEATIPQLGWSGEISKTYLLAKDSQIEAGKIGASVVGQKIFTMTLTISALSAGLALVLLKYSLPSEAMLLIGLVLALSILTLAIVYYVSYKPSATKNLLNISIKIVSFFRKNWNPQNFRAKAEEMLSTYHVGITQLRAKPKALIQAIVFALIGFVFEVSVVFLSFIALGQPVPVDVVLIVFTLTGTLQTVGVTLFGFPELIMTMTFTALYIDPAVAVSVALLTRLVNLWFRLIVSYLALQWAGIKIIKQDKARL